VSPLEASNTTMLVAANTFRTTGLVMATIAVVAYLGYLAYNYIWGRGDIGSELELAANKKPYLEDAELETKKLDLSLTVGLATIAVIGLALPLYWLGEPGRQEGYIELTTAQLASRGEHLFEESCSGCHGLGAVGGTAPYTVTDSEGGFIANVTWRAPALTTVLYRFSEDEVRYVLNFGRQNSPMPAWGAPGGGPLTTQAVDELVVYLSEIQLDPAEVTAEVDEGIEQSARAVVVAANPDLQGDEAAIMAEVEQYIEAATEEQLGELLFTNPIGSGAYSCARCHTAGWSWDSNGVAVDPEQPFSSLISLQVSGGGGFGPNLTGGATVRQFPNSVNHADFISIGAQDGVAYGSFGQGDGGGQMPAFGVCVGDRGSSDISPVFGFCEVTDADGVVSERPGVLTPEQIDAVVAYERSL